MQLLAAILIDGVAYGMILFMVSVGLAVTLGLMRVVNLAQGAFAMLGGYLTSYFAQTVGVPYEVSLALAVIAAAIISVPVEVLLMRRVYRRSQLDQALLSIGVMFVCIALANIVFGSTLKFVPLPEYMAGTLDLGFRYIPKQRVFLIALGFVVFAALWFAVEKTSFGNRIRATVDNPQMAAAIGVNTNRVYAVAFAVGAGLAALGGVAGAEILPMEPTYPIKYLVLFLAVVAVGGMGSLTGVFVAALALGVFETGAKYLVPDLSSILFFLAMIVVLTWRPHGLLGRKLS